MKIYENLTFALFALLMVGCVSVEHGPVYKLEVIPLFYYERDCVTKDKEFELFGITIFEDGE